MEPTPFIIKKNDTLPALVVNIRTRGDLGQVIPMNLTPFNSVDGTCTFSMRNKTNELKVYAQTAVILCASGGTLQYSWNIGDTDTAGDYFGEFELKDGAGGVLSVPPQGGIAIKIVPDINTYS